MSAQRTDASDVEFAQPSVEPTVYVIEDDPSMRQSLEKLFRASDVPTQLFCSPEEFLGCASADLIGCLVIDLELPGMDGLQLQEKLSSLGCELPFIIITGYGDVPRVIEAFRRGAVDLIEKPFRMEQLLDRVREAMQRSEVLSAQSEVGRLRKSLTPRESELMELLVEGLSTKQAALQMNVSPKTAYIHRSRILAKMGVTNVAQLVHRVEGKVSQ